MIPPGDEFRSRSREVARQWAKYHGNLSAFVYSLVVNFSEAEELLQETAAEIFEHIDRYDSSRPFLPWAMGIARNVVLNHRRKMARDRHIFDSEALERLTHAFENMADRHDAVRERFATCYHRLSARSREACRLRYEFDQTPEEIAVHLGATVSAICSLLFRSREQLRLCIEEGMRSRGEKQ